MTTAVPLDLCHSVRSLKGSLRLRQRRNVYVDILFFGGGRPLHLSSGLRYKHIPDIGDLLFMLVYYIYTNQKVMFPLYENVKQFSYYQMNQIVLFVRQLRKQSKQTYPTWITVLTCCPLISMARSPIHQRLLSSPCVYCIRQRALVSLRCGAADGLGMISGGINLCGGTRWQTDPWPLLSIQFQDLRGTQSPIQKLSLAWSLNVE